MPIDANELVPSIFALLTGPWPTGIATAAEIAAGVTPTNFVYTELSVERYGGSPSSSAAANNTALANAISVATSKGGGIIQHLNAGTYQYSSSFVVPRSTTIQGLGYSTILNYTGAGSFLSLNSTSSRASLQSMILQGTAQTGVGITLGDASGNVGFAFLSRVMITGFATGMRMGGATWLTCIKCEFGNASGINAGTIVTTNNIGIDFNYFNTGNYSSALTFQDCVVSNNATQGVRGAGVSVFMNSICWYNCNVQNNCQGTPANPQFEMGRVSGFVIDALYVEYLGSGTVPDAIRADNNNNGQIRNSVIFQSANGIVDRTTGSVTDVEVLGCGITASSAAISLINESNVTVRGCNLSGAVSVSGPGCNYLPSGAGLASWPINESVFTPALVGSGTSGLTLAAATYSQVGNIVSFSLRFNWTGGTAPAGTVTITGMPKAPVSGGPDCVFALMTIGVTITAGSLVGYLVNGTTTLNLYNVQTTTASVQGTAFTNNSGSLIVSGSYQV